MCKKCKRRNTPVTEAIRAVLGDIEAPQLEEDEVVSIPAQPVADIIKRSKRRAAEPVYNVEDILKKRGKGKRAQYHVVWQGGEETWEPHANVENILDHSWSFQNKKMKGGKSPCKGKSGK